MKFEALRRVAPIERKARECARATHLVRTHLRSSRPNLRTRVCNPSALRECCAMPGPVACCSCRALGATVDRLGVLDKSTRGRRNYALYALARAIRESDRNRAKIRCMLATKSSWRDLPLSRAFEPIFCLQRYLGEARESQALSVCCKASKTQSIHAASIHVACFVVVRARRNISAMIMDTIIFTIKNTCKHNQSKSAPLISDCDQMKTRILYAPPFFVYTLKYDRFLNRSACSIQKASTYHVQCPI